MRWGNLASWPLSRTDKLCLAALAGVVLAASLLDWSMDAAAYRAAEVDKPKLELAEVVPPSTVRLLWRLYRLCRRSRTTSQSR